MGLSPALAATFREAAAEVAHVNTENCVRLFFEEIGILFRNSKDRDPATLRFVELWGKVCDGCQEFTDDQIRFMQGFLLLKADKL